MTPKKDNILLIAVNLDAKAAHSCRIEIPLWEFGLPDESGIEAENLLTGERFTLRGKNQDLHLSPNAPCVIWRLTPPAEARP
jgi:starch synthase (maltosyl-transferring)